MYKIVVLHKSKSKSNYKFPGGGNWADHYMMLKRDVDAGVYVSAELWRKSRAIATGEKGEEVWDLIERYPERD